MKLTYYRELDGIRAIGALMVMLTHFHKYWGLGDEAVLTQKVGLMGKCGVSLFFVLSGYLITRILISTKDQEGYFKNFFIRRTLRIFPLYYFSLLIYYFGLPLLGYPVTPFGEQTYYWLYMQDFGLTFDWKMTGPELYWSLAVEEHFYLFWPLLVYFLPRKYLIHAILGLVMASIVMRMILIGTGFEVYFFTFSRMDELALGALLAYFGLGKPSRKVARLCLLVFALAMISNMLLWVVFSGMGLTVLQVLKYTFIGVSFACFLGYVLSVRESNWLKRGLKNRFLSYTGKISYGLYIYHPLTFSVYHKYLNTGLPLVNFVLAFSFTYLVAGLTYKYFESPLLGMKDRFTKKKVIESSPVRMKNSSTSRKSLESPALQIVDRFTSR